MIFPCVLFFCKFLYTIQSSNPDKWWHPSHPWHAMTGEDSHLGVLGGTEIERPHREAVFFPEGFKDVRSWNILGIKVGYIKYICVDF